MPLRDVPLPQGTTGVTGLPRQRERLYNFFRRDGILNRPGLSPFAVGEGECRASFVYQRQLHQVSGNTLIRINSTGVTSDLGFISGVGKVNVAVDFAGVALVSDGVGFTLVDSTLASITDPDYLPSRDVTVIGGRFVYTPLDGGPLFYSEVGQPGNIDPLNFFDAEQLPDENIGTAEHRGDLLVFGSEVTEVFRNVGPDESPFIAVQGGRIPIGYFGGKVKYKIGQETVAFLGRDEDGGVGFFAIGIGRISNPAINEILQSYTVDELLTCRGNRFQWNGVDMISFHLPRNTFVYNGDWFEWGSGVDEAPWQGLEVTYVYGMHIVGTTGVNVGFLDDTSVEFGEAYERFFDTFVRSQRDSHFNLNALEIDAYFDGEAGSIGLQMSNGGVFNGPTFWRDTPPAGQPNQRVQWSYPGGLGSYESFAGIRVRTTGETKLSTDSLWVDDGNG